MRIVGATEKADLFGELTTLPEPYRPARRGTVRKLHLDAIGGAIARMGARGLLPIQYLAARYEQALQAGQWEEADRRALELMPYFHPRKMAVGVRQFEGDGDGGPLRLVWGTDEPGGDVVSSD